MANTTWYGNGLTTVAVGSRTVTGTDTGWLTEVAGLTPIKAGDKYGIHVGRPIVIEKIISDTELLLADDWPGPAQTDAFYKVELTSPTIAAVEAMRRLLASLSNGNLDSLSEITVGTDDIPIGIGPGVFGTIKKFELKDGVQFNEWVPNLAGRAAYNGAAKDFAVLVIDIGDGRSAIYFKNSATSGDWSAPSYVTGPVGPAGVNQRGNYSAGTAYAIRDIVQYGGSTWIAKVATTGNAPPALPTTENTQWLLFARSGTQGVVDRGTYSGATAYAGNDIVLNNGSTWIALQSTTGNAPPVLPAESNEFWRLLARKGADGTGIGDVVGPAGGVAINDLAVYADITGKLIKKAPNNIVGNALLAQVAPAIIKGRLTAGTGDVEDLTAAQANQLLGGWEPIGKLDLATQSAGIVNNLSVFRAIRCHADFSAESSAYAAIQVSTDNGATFITTSATYPFIIVDGGGTGTVTGGNGTVPGLLLGNGLAGSVISIFSFNKARIARSVGHQNYQTTSEVLRQIGQKIDSSVARNAIRVLASSGVFSYGEFFFEGIRG